jgi:hypothetical protein
MFQWDGVPDGKAPTLRLFVRGFLRLKFMFSSGVAGARKPAVRRAANGRLAMWVRVGFPVAAPA